MRDAYVEGFTSTDPDNWSEKEEAGWEGWKVLSCADDKWKFAMSEDGRSFQLHDIDSRMLTPEQKAKISEHILKIAKHIDPEYNDNMLCAVAKTILANFDLLTWNTTRILEHPAWVTEFGPNRVAIGVMRAIIEVNGVVLAPTKYDTECLFMKVLDKISDKVHKMYSPMPRGCMSRN
jgi:hypothetical protein